MISRGKNGFVYFENLALLKTLAAAAPVQLASVSAFAHESSNTVYRLCAEHWAKLYLLLRSRRPTYK